MSTITDPIARMRYLIARTTNFRVWCGITTGTEDEKLAAALEHIYLLWEDIDSISLPFVNIEWGKFSGDRIGMGGGAFQMKRSVITRFYKEYIGTSEAAVRQELLTFNSEVVAIINDMKNLSGTGTAIDFSHFERKNNPVATPRGDDVHWLMDEWEWSGDFWGSQTET